MLEFNINQNPFSFPKPLTKEHGISDSPVRHRDSPNFLPAQKEESWMKKSTTFHYWLVVGPPLWKIWKSIGMISNPIYGKIKNGNQTTNQNVWAFLLRNSIFPPQSHGQIHFVLAQSPIFVLNPPCLVIWFRILPSAKRLQVGPLQRKGYTNKSHKNPVVFHHMTPFQGENFPLLLVNWSIPHLSG